MLKGAGKTTTMRIMTGETAPGRGQVKIGGHNITINKDEAFRTLGYCPQHDALWKNITVREHLGRIDSVTELNVSNSKINKCKNC